VDQEDPLWWLHLEKPSVQSFLEKNGLTPEEYANFLLEEVYHEPPVSMREFMFSPDYCAFSGHDDLWPNVQAILEEFDNPRYREAHLGLGRGSGKSMCSGVFLARSAYWLHNLRDPWAFYRLKKNTLLCCLNVSVSGAQAQSVVFDNLSAIIENSKYFKGKFTKRTALGHADFYFPAKHLKAISGHSGSTVWRGYAIYAGVGDEFSWFQSKNNKDNAEDIYDVLKGSMTTRFANSYKLMLISSLKSKNDFLCKSLNNLRKEAKGSVGIENLDTVRQELGIEE
jgi:hypothetical protein